MGGYVQLPNRIVILLTILLCGGQTPFSAPLAARDVFIYTENYPPYNYADENAAIVGDATTLVEKVMRESGLEYRITLVPWARAVRFTETADNALIYSIARVPAREKRFQWLVPLANDEYYLFARSGDTRTFTRPQIISGSVKVVCVFGDISCLLLRQSGIPNHSIVTSSALSRPGSMKLVEAGRVDLYTAGIINYRTNIKEQGFHEAAFKPVFKLDVGLTLYLAGGVITKPEITNAISKAYERLKAKDDFQMMYVDGPALDN